MRIARSVPNPSIKVDEAGDWRCSRRDYLVERFYDRDQTVFGTDRVVYLPLSHRRLFRGHTTHSVPVVRLNQVSVPRPISRSSRYDGLHCCCPVLSQPLLSRGQSQYHLPRMVEYLSRRVEYQDPQPLGSVLI